MEKNLLSTFLDIASNRKNDDPFVDNFLSQEICFLTGLFHLTYDNDWHCLFASDHCSDILDCTPFNFWDTFQNLIVFTIYKNSQNKVSKKTIKTILREILAVNESVSFISSRALENGNLQYIKGELIVSQTSSSSLSIYGQISDISKKQAKDLQFQNLKREFNSSLQISGRVTFRYQIDSRQAIISPIIAKKEGLPEVIDNFPEWAVNSGFVYPQSVNTWYEVFNEIQVGEKQGSKKVIFKARDEKTFRHYKIDFINHCDETGKPIYAIISYIDITDEFDLNSVYSIDRAGLLQFTEIVFSEVLHMNLSKGTYRMIQYDDSLVNVPVEGMLDDLISTRVQNIATEDRDFFIKQFQQDNLIGAILDGKKRIQLTYRWQGIDGLWHWIESIVMQQDNPYDDDILTIAVSKNIDQQKIQEDLLQQALSDSISKLDGWLYYTSLCSQYFPGLTYVNYDDGRISPYVFGTLAKDLDCPAKELALSTCFRIPETDKNALQYAYEQAKLAGKKSYQAEYRVVQDKGETAWICNNAVYFEDKDGSKGYIHFLTDVTQEHVLMDQIRHYMEEKLSENQKIFDVVAQHTNRILCYYDIQKKLARPWSEKSCTSCKISHICLKKFSLEQLKGNFVLQESSQAARQLFKNIHDGVPNGEAVLHMKMPDTTERWIEFKYSSFFNEKTPVAAILSFEDVTEYHEQKIAYLRHIQYLESNKDEDMVYVEEDLTTGLVERLTGTIISQFERKKKYPISEFRKLVLNDKFLYKEDEESARYFDPKNLIEQYNHGERLLKSKWKIQQKEKGNRWVDVETVLIEDPYNGHIKAFHRMKDVTKEQEERFSILQQAHYDSMTGLYRKTFGENQIKAYLEQKDEKSGVLIILDLDDMKGINDNLGHKEGDIAIKSIANTLKNHFRQNDILVRAGGDEFVAFLPQAGQSINAVALSLKTLLKKLSNISVGNENKPYYLQCSVGCAVEQPGIDTYDSLFKRADMALYHVKRSGKNNFAFYVPEMSKADYQFKAKPIVSAIKESAKEDEWQRLLKITSSPYFQVVLFNLSKDYFRILNIGHHVQTEPLSGTVDEFWKHWKKNIHLDDQADTIAALSKETLLSQYTHGKQQIQYYYREMESVNQEKVEVKVHFYLTDDENVCAFLFFQRNVTFEKELELLRLQKILELSSAENIEYICLINVMNKNYFTFSRDIQNSHHIPESADFDDVTRFIRDTFIPLESRDIYYKHAIFDRILQCMRENGSYSYQYTMIDGITREAVFSWYEENHLELLMLVRKIS